METNNVFSLSNQRPMAKNIIDVQIPDILFERIESTVEWIDSIITPEGGFIPSFTVLISGMSGAGKSTLLRQLADGFTSQDHIVLYNSTEESEFQIAIAAKKLALEYGFIISNEHSVQALLQKANALKALHPEQKFILIHDSIQTMDDHTLDVVTALNHWAKETESLTFMVGQVTKEGSFAGSNKILHAVDVHIDMRRNKKTLIRALTVSKNRGGAVSEEPIVYTMTNKGLVVDTEFDTSKLTFDPITENNPLDPGVGSSVKIIHKGKHYKKICTVTKIGRTRVSVIDEEGTSLYLPIDWISLI